MNVTAIPASLPSNAGVDDVRTFDTPVASDPGQASGYGEGQALAGQMLSPETWNDPEAVSQLFEANAAQLQDPDFAAGFIEGFPPDMLSSLPGNFPYANGEQQVALSEHFSDALAAASHSDQLSQQWRDDFFAGAADSQLTRFGIGQLMRSGEFSTDFLMQAMREVVNVAAEPGTSQNPATWSLSDPSLADNGLGWILEAVARNPEAASLATAAFAEKMIDNPYLDGRQTGLVFEAGTVAYRGTDPGMAEYAATQLIAVVDAKDGKLPFGMDDAMAAIATEYFDDIAYAANSPVDLPLDQQDPLRDGIEMPFESAHDLLYAAAGASPEALADLTLAFGEWQAGLQQSYGGDPNLSSAFGRQVGATEAMLTGALADRMIDDGRTSDQQLQSARDGLTLILGGLSTGGYSGSSAALGIAKKLVTNLLFPASDQEAQARAAYVQQTFQNRRDGFLDAANYLLVDPANLTQYTLGQNPPVVVDISPATFIARYESDLQAQYIAGGYYTVSVDADFTVSDGQGGLQIMPLDEMSAHQRAAYVQWVSSPEVQQVLLQQVTHQNQGADDTVFGLDNQP